MRKYVVYDSSKQANLQYDTQELHKLAEQLDVDASIKRFQRRHEKHPDPSLSPPSPSHDVNGKVLHLPPSAVKLYNLKKMEKIADQNDRAAKSEAAEERRRASDAAETVDSILGAASSAGRGDSGVVAGARSGGAGSGVKYAVPPPPPPPPGSPPPANAAIARHSRSGSDALFGGIVTGFSTIASGVVAIGDESLSLAGETLAQTGWLGSRSASVSRSDAADEEVEVDLGFASV